MPVPSQTLGLSSSILSSLPTLNPIHPQSSASGNATAPYLLVACWVPPCHGSYTCILDLITHDISPNHSFLILKMGRLSFISG